ncbi:Polynucleotide kinase-3'-phosphatase [Operophtera brumata]|uniref:Polynucleotide kinase-3'-phosphatase n=1 Tax=Operophtera brumata TaxID=104452 RepID=A0A0L7L2G9_OPEBR|nr:Polynucleotide kinase-3'-phosphatase [Operophtera brumata]
MPRQCFFKCLLDTHSPLKLLHNAETIIGRSKLTKIKDQSCSRQQITLKADCEECLVEIKQLGVNSSGLNGFALKKNEVYKVGHGSRIEVLLNNYVHIIEFDPPPDGNDQPRPSLKRKLEEDSSPIKQKILKTEIEQKNTISITEAVENMWVDFDTCQLYIFTSKGVKSSKKIAAFDMDGTLIKTKSGKVYPVDTKDWQIAFPQVSKKLKEHFEKGYKIVIISNQAPIGNGRVKIEDFQKKIEAIVEKLDVPIQVYIATGKGFYRKPSTWMWKTLAEKQSFYCGDAVGRVANWAPGKKKDHSMADKLMAENLGLTFYTPEQFFLGHSITNVPINKPGFIPKDILVLVGFPGSGKSFIAQQIEKKSGHQYVAVCRDEMSVECRCAKMATTKEHAQHNNKYRELMKINHVPVNDIVFHSYNEGFKEVIEVKFNPSFDDKEAENIYRMYLLEK